MNDYARQPSGESNGIAHAIGLLEAKQADASKSIDRLWAKMDENTGMIVKMHGAVERLDSHFNNIPSVISDLIHRVSAVERESSTEVIVRKVNESKKPSEADESVGSFFGCAAKSALRNVVIAGMTMLILGGCAGAIAMLWSNIAQG